MISSIYEKRNVKPGTNEKGGGLCPNVLNIYSCGLLANSSYSFNIRVWLTDINLLGFKCGCWSL